MVISDLRALGSDRPIPEIAVIINVGTKYVATLALLSTLRYAKIPTVLIDCESADGSLEWFRRLMDTHDFHLMSAPLRQHGETLDRIFKEIAAERILLVDSDAEMLNDAMIVQMRAMLETMSRSYGAGYLHPAHWLECHYFSALPIASGIGYYMERPWIPFTLLRVETVRTALAQGRSFMHRLVRNDVAQSRLLSRLLWERFRFSWFRKHRLSWLDLTRGEYNGEKPSYVSYDTGADVHEYLTREMKFQFGTVNADFVPWSVNHFSGITRAALNSNASDDAYRLADAHPTIAQRLKDLYRIDLSAAGTQ